MSEQLKPLTALFAVLWTTACAMAAAPATIDVDVNRPGIAIPASFYGLMTEEINHSYDGGLFAELIQNRTFQDPLPPLSGKKRPPHCVTPVTPFAREPRYMLVGFAA